MPLTDSPGLQPPPNPPGPLKRGKRGKIPAKFLHNSFERIGKMGNFEACNKRGAWRHCFCGRLPYLTSTRSKTRRPGRVGHTPLACRYTRFCGAKIEKCIHNGKNSKKVKPHNHEKSINHHGIYMHGLFCKCAE